MSDKSTIYEITQLMNDKKLIQNDLDEVLSIIKDVIHQKYISKFQLALDEQKELVSKNTPKEITLLVALKPFLEETSHTYIDQIIDIMYKVSTAKSIDAEIQKCSIHKTDNTSSECELTIHDDGIYELDNHCKINKNFSSINITEIIFMLLVTGTIK
jgi:hypothetical protein